MSHTTPEKQRLQEQLPPPSAKLKKNQCLLRKSNTAQQRQAAHSSTLLETLTLTAKKGKERTTDNSNLVKMFIVPIVQINKWLLAPSSFSF